MKPELLIIGAVTERMMEKLEANFIIHELSKISDLDTWLNESSDKVSAIATNGHDGVKPELMSALNNLKVISCYGVGYDAIDAQAAITQNVVISHTPNVLNADVANLAILLMLASSRNLVQEDKWVRSGNWASKGNAALTRSIENKKVGILGLGRIGNAIAEKLQVFNCEISYHTRTQKDVSYPHFESLQEMASDVDYLIVIAPGGASTHHLVNENILNALGPQGTLINVGRGSVVDEQALIAALKEKRLGWAALDVFEDEPNVPAELCAMENVTLTPHSGSATQETRQAMGDLTVDNLLHFFAVGKLLTPVPECQDS